MWPRTARSRLPFLTNSASAVLDLEKREVLKKIFSLCRVEQKLSAAGGFCGLSFIFLGSGQREQSCYFWRFWLLIVNSRGSQRRCVFFEKDYCSCSRRLLPTRGRELCRVDSSNTLQVLTWSVPCSIAWCGTVLGWLHPQTWDTPAYWLNDLTLGQAEIHHIWSSLFWATAGRTVYNIITPRWDCLPRC